MGDVIFIAVMIVFFLLCAMYVQLCDRMIGSDEVAMAGQGTDTAADAQSATLVTAIAQADDAVTA